MKKIIFALALSVIPTVYASEDVKESAEKAPFYAAALEKVKSHPYIAGGSVSALVTAAIAAYVYETYYAKDADQA